MKLAILVNQMPDIIYSFQPSLIFQNQTFINLTKNFFNTKDSSFEGKKRPLEKYCLGSRRGRIQIMVLTTFPFRFPLISSFFVTKVETLKHAFG